MKSNEQTSIDSIRESLRTQFDISWGLLEYHLVNLGDEEGLWKPCRNGVGIEKRPEGWHIDWPESEGYDIGPPNIAWIAWHIIFWWSMVFDYSFGEQTLKREDLTWPDTMSNAKEIILKLRKDWIDKLTTLSDEQLVSTELTRWPFEGKPFHVLAAWLNLELMKNSAEIGYCRFLYANRDK